MTNDVRFSVLSLAMAVLNIIFSAVALICILVMVITSPQSGITSQRTHASTPTDSISPLRINGEYYVQTETGRCYRRDSNEDMYWYKRCEDIIINSQHLRIERTQKIEDLGDIESVEDLDYSIACALVIHEGNGKYKWIDVGCPKN